MKRISGAMVVAALATVLAGCGSSSTKTVTVRAPAKTTASSPSGTTAHTTTAHTTTAQATTRTSTASAGQAGLAPGGALSTLTLTAPPTPPPPVKTVSLREFRSPTANLGCEMYTLGGGGARCDIAKRKWTPPKRPANCQLDYGQGLEVNGSGNGRFTCAGDTALNPKATPLPYGQASHVGMFTCFSETNGMTCRNDATKHGFFVSIEGYSAF